MWSKNSQLRNFTNDSTITYSAETIENLVKNLKVESEDQTEVIRWFQSNEVIVNPRKLQIIKINKKGQSKILLKLHLIESVSLLMTV